MFGKGGFGGGDDAVRVGDVDVLNGDLPAAPEVLDRGFEDLRVAVPERDRSAGLEQPRCDGEANSLPASSDYSITMMEIDLIHVRLNNLDL
jgi:hypothetical protein